MVPMIKVRCIRCDWEGEVETIDSTSECPECGAKGSIEPVDDDGVSPQDYIDQNPREVPDE